eukprot:2735047-Lingulodinium_polyedra.AAC.1
MGAGKHQRPQVPNLVLLLPRGHPIILLPARLVGARARHLLGPSSGGPAAYGFNIALPPLLLQH